jgi:hypothetical protein
MFCHKCGNQIAKDAGFCHKCGSKVVRVDENTAQQTPLEPIVVSTPPPRVSTPTPTSRVGQQTTETNVTAEEANTTVKNMPDSAETQTEVKKAGCLGPACATIGITGLLGSLSYGFAVSMYDARIPIFISLGILGVGVLSDIATWMMKKLK